MFYLLWPITQDSTFWFVYYKIRKILTDFFYILSCDFVVNFIRGASRVGFGLFQGHLVWIENETRWVGRWVGKSVGGWVGGMIVHKRTWKVHSLCLFNSMYLLLNERCRREERRRSKTSYIPESKYISEHWSSNGPSTRGPRPVSLTRRVLVKNPFTVLVFHPNLLTHSTDTCWVFSDPIV